MRAIEVFSSFLDVEPAIILEKMGVLTPYWMNNCALLSSLLLFLYSFCFASLHVLKIFVGSGISYPSSITPINLNTWRSSLFECSNNQGIYYKKGTRLVQETHDEDLSKKFNMDDYNLVITPMVVNKKLGKNNRAPKESASFFWSLFG